MRGRAVVFTAPNAVEFADVVCPEPGDDDVVVRVTHSWISTGTEYSYLRGERIAGDTPWREGDPLPFPKVPGYQKVGVIEHIGANVTGLAVGQTVFTTLARVDGMFRPMSGHVSPSVTSREHVYAIPEDPDPVAFSGTVLTQVGYNIGTRASIAPAEPAVVLGDGLVGLWAAQTLAWRGADVLLVGRHPERLALFGPRERRRTLDIRSTDLLEALDRAFPAGVAVIVDAVGRMGQLQRAATRLRRFGHIVSAGFYGDDDRLALQPLRDAEAFVHLVSGFTPERIDRTIALIGGGELETLPLITHRFSADRAVDAWRLIRERREPFLGVVLDWSVV